MKIKFKKFKMFKNENGNSITKRIEELENIVGVEKKKVTETTRGSLLTDMFFPTFSYSWKPQDLTSKVKSLRDDFEELDKKFDALERYLEIEYFKETSETQTYDWADKNTKEGFRKTKPFEAVKKSKECKDSSRTACDCCE